MSLISKISFHMLKKTFWTTVPLSTRMRERIFAAVAILFWSLTLLGSYVSLSGELLGNDMNYFILFVGLAYVINVLGAWFSIKPTWSKISLFAIGSTFVIADILSLSGILLPCPPCEG